MPVTIVCKACQQSFAVPPAWEKKRQFCSASCRETWKAAQVVACEQCGKSFHLPASRLKKGARFCSHACASAAKQIAVVDRYWPKVIKDGPVVRPELGPCWGWRGSTHDHGYGRIVEGNRSNKPLYAHRISWELHFGPIPEGMSVLHKCDNPPCSRPEHLFLGTQTTNNADRDVKDRVQHGDRHANAKLTAREVARMRALHAAGGLTIREMGKLFDVSHQTASDAINGRTWKRLPESS